MYEVTCGNIGTVYSGDSREEARQKFATYVEQSKSERGRAGGEDVVLWENGEPIEEFDGSLHQSEE